VRLAKARCITISPAARLDNLHWIEFKRMAGFELMPANRQCDASDAPLAMERVSS
jgi:hypothetical protein